MSVSANTLAPSFAVGLGYSPDICRDESCIRPGIHTPAMGCMRSEENKERYKTRSKRFAIEPWRVQSVEALRESVYRNISAEEPRNFATVWRLVEEDYGSCCNRSVHRHLNVLREIGRIVRLEFSGLRIHAYLRAGSRLIRDPGIVLEQILDIQAGEMAWA